MREKWKRRLVGFFVIGAMLLTGVPDCVLATENGSIDTDISGEIEVNLNYDVESFQAYIDAFHVRYPNIVVHYNYLNNYEEDLRVRMDQGSPGDVMFVPSYMDTSEYAQRFEPLGRSEVLSNKYAFLEQSKVVNGTVYGLASDAYLSGFLYNSRVFYNAGITELPTTIDEFLEDLHLIKERTDAIPFYTNYEANWTQQYWEDFPFVEMTGNSDYKGTAFLDEKNPYLEGTTHYKVYKLLYDIVAQGLCEENPQKSDWAKSKEMLNEGKIGCMCIGSWALGQMRAAGSHGKDISFMPFPNNIDGKQYSTIATDYCYAVNKNSENKEAAKAFVNFMIDESGYATDHDTLSIVKSDPYPEAYSIENLVILYNRGSTPEFQRKSDALHSKLDIRNTDEIRRVIAAAAGFADESFDDIMTDWNTRWESSRTPDMVDEDTKDYTKENKEVVLDYEVKFSDSEQQYLKRTKELNAGYLRGMLPFQDTGKDSMQNDTACGVAKEVCNVISEKSKINFKMIPYNNTAEMVKALEKGEIDVIACMDNQYDKAKNVKYSKAYVTAMKALVTKNAKISEDENLGKAAVIKGEKAYFYGEDNDEKATFDSLSQSIEAVENDNVNYSVQNYYSANYCIQKLKLEDVKLIPMS
ncbi:MAG: extracellular solute-binding protein, partial [Lachnospiraceae bacterium]